MKNQSSDVPLSGIFQTLTFQKMMNPHHMMLKGMPIRSERLNAMPCFGRPLHTMRSP